MADAWSELQEIKNKRLSLREKLAKRKREREGLLSAAATAGRAPVTKDLVPPAAKVVRPSDPVTALTPVNVPNNGCGDGRSEPSTAEVERQLVQELMQAVDLPMQSEALSDMLSQRLAAAVSTPTVQNVLHKLAAQDIVSVRETGRRLEVTSVEHARLQVLATEAGGAAANENTAKQARQADPKADDIMNLLALPSAREKENKRMGEEILDLLNKPTVKERITAERFRSQGGAQVQEYCRHGTREECARSNKENTAPCGKLHFRKILQKHTDETLGDCSFLNTCFHMDTCKYVHYEVDYSGKDRPAGAATVVAATSAAAAAAAAVSGGGGPVDSGGAVAEVMGAVARPVAHEPTVLFPPQWIQCDLRFFDMSVIGECAVIMADPPWDIHMELPYGTMADDEMRSLNIPTLQKSGLMFLWVTGRAMELGRECLSLWGYERVDELIWVKSNQLQRIIRTGRTGHWLNHGKGEPQFLNRGLDADVLVAEVRATSHKPDEIYGIIERLSPGTRKLELFGRPHNAQPNWITLGNQVDGVNLSDPEIVERFKQRYPDGDCMKPPP